MIMNEHNVELGSVICEYSELEETFFELPAALIPLQLQTHQHHQCFCTERGLSDKKD